MTKAEAIRAALGRRRMTLRELLPQVERRSRIVIGRKALYLQLAMMKTAGEIEAEGRGEDRVYSMRGKG